MRVLANSIPKAGTHLLLRLLTLLDFDLTDFGGLRPTRVSDGNRSAADRYLRTVLGMKPPGKFLGIGPHLVEDGRLPSVRAVLRTRGP